MRNSSSRLSHGRSLLYKSLSAVTAALFICAAVFTVSVAVSQKLPATICLRENESKTIDFDIPITANMEIIQSSSVKSVKAVNFHEPVSFIAGDAGEYHINVKFLGLFNIKTVQVNVMSKSSLIPCGFPVGIYLRTDGILVAGTTEFTDINGQTVMPCSDLVKTGDYIVSVNDSPITTKSEFMSCVNSCGGSPLILGIRRSTGTQNNSGTQSSASSGHHSSDASYGIVYVSVTPVRDARGDYKTGIWVKDDSQGIGTLTYIASDNSFGALGHPISDTDSGCMLSIKNGALYNARILSIAKGQRGKPGEFIGSINYNESNRIGTVTENKTNGIYGFIDNPDSLTELYGLKQMDIGFKEDIKKGEAYIQTFVSGRCGLYRINIDDLSYNDEGNRNITFSVTDKNLLAITNGIVQGMSGSPIIQNDRIIGAVTHVFVDDSTCGYGIFIENMLN